jgi:hypothetical protein
MIGASAPPRDEPRSTITLDRPLWVCGAIAVASWVTRSRISEYWGMLRSSMSSNTSVTSASNSHCTPGSTSSRIECIILAFPGPPQDDRSQESPA